MRFRDLLRHEGSAPPAVTTSPGGAPTDLDGAQKEGERLLAAGDAAIDRALSGNSEEFLSANRQQGGQ